MSVFGVGEDVEIIFLEKDGDTVKIGINAPRSIRVFRKEIFEEIKAANQNALRIPGMEDLLKEFKSNTENEEK